uniref:Uncharacterized protein n=1 Tax=Vespula pensylvanica TaxID=30213 RepID=A0A834PF04_VESPE|nr:hypothetical protein H0235_000838 [Vespula pensylvanica]
MLALYKCLVVGSRSSCFQDPIQTQLTSLQSAILPSNSFIYFFTVLIRASPSLGISTFRDCEFLDTDVHITIFKKSQNTRLILRIGVPRQGFKAIDRTNDVAYCGVEREKEGGKGGGGGGGGVERRRRRRRAAAKCGRLRIREKEKDGG